MLKVTGEKNLPETAKRRVPQIFLAGDGAAKTLHVKQAGGESSRSVKGRETLKCREGVLTVTSG